MNYWMVCTYTLLALTCYLSVYIIKTNMKTTKLPSVEDYKRSFNCLFIWWINGMAFGLGIITIMKIFSLWTM